MIPGIIQDCLDGKNGNYVLPFIWYAGENKELLAKEIDAVKACGANEFVFENRGGDWFATDFWWDIFKFVLEYAKSLGMRVWCLDDSHVNTGSANDSLSKEENARFRAKNLRLDVIDVVGPLVSGAVALPRRMPKDKIIRITAFQLNEKGQTFGQGIDFSSNVKDGLCLVDLPEGIWRIYFLMQADPERNGVFKNYITMVSRESCRHLIDEVHEKMYDHFSDYFGNTFAGFFSDEPAFGNCDGQYGPYAYELRPGQLDKMFPWWDDFPELLAEKYGTDPEDIMKKLPALWDDMVDVSAGLRLVYMDLITALWEKNFSRQIGKWCEEHHVEYIGHNLEDAGAHMRSGWGCGHYFRSMSGQHMSGMDLVFEQLIPGISTFEHGMNSSSRKRDSVFYHYTLPKLAASLAHITPGMKNRALSEVFGATGWTCGISIMYGMWNTCLISGVNHFIPHAFSMSLPEAFDKQPEREDSAGSYTPPGYCLRYLPPTFYTGGFNPQFRMFGELVRCIRRVSHLTANTIHQPDVAVYYNAESDWVNIGKYQSVDQVALTLTRSGYDFDFLPLDVLLGDNIRIADGKLLVNQESFSALIMPPSQFIPEKLLNKIHELSASGVPVIFSESLPEYTENGSARCGKWQTATLENLPKTLSLLVKPNFRPGNMLPDLRHYCFKDADGQVGILLYNSGLTDMDIEIDGSYGIFDPWSDRIYRNNASGKLHLRRQQLLAIFPGADWEAPEVVDESALSWQNLPLKYDIFMRNAGDEEFQLLKQNSPAVNLLTGDNMTRCCAEFCYKTNLTWSENDSVFLEIPQAGDGAELLINGESCGFSIGPVCRFDVSGKMRAGENSIEIRTFDNPSYVDRDGEKFIGYGSGFPLLQHGFTGDIRIGSLKNC